MEEILASIRRIISEDDAPASDDAAPGDPPKLAEAVAPPAGPVIETAPVALESEPEPEPDPQPQAKEEDEVLELTERVETHGDIDVYTPPAAEPEPVPEREVEAVATPEPAFAPVASESLVAAATATAAASAFGQLSAAIAMPKDGRTLEDVVRELLRPLLKDWLDQNLPAIVQASVAEEVERIARSRAR